MPKEQRAPSMGNLCDLRQALI